MTESALEVDEALLLLRDAGLVILPQGESRSRFHIRRPRSVEGNRRLEYSRNLIGFVNNEPVVVETLDAPMSMLERSESSEMWNFSVWEWCPDLVRAISSGHTQRCGRPFPTYWATISVIRGGCAPSGRRTA